MLAGAFATAQTAEFAHLATGPGAGCLLVADPLRDRVIALESYPESRLWEWDGMVWAQRLGAGSLGSSVPFTAFYDAGRRALVALGTAEHVWDGVRWNTFGMPAPGTSLTNSLKAHDSHRQRHVVFNGVDVAEWDGAQWHLTSPIPSPGYRDAAFAYDPVHRRTLLYGGHGMDDLWSWDGSGWTVLQLHGAPGARDGASFGCDAATGRMVLYGGDAAPHATWALAGTLWTRITTAHDAGPRAGARMVFDGKGLLLIGGSATQGGELWRFQNGDWIELDGGTPVPRNDPAWAWDPARGETVLFGGSSGYQQTRQLHSDTWTFGDRWRHHAIPGPSPRSHAGLAWSAVDNAMLLFGGAGATDTWSWNGAAWAQRTSPATPPWRTEMAFAPDPGGGVLMFGGGATSSPLGDQWRWNGSGWQQLAPAPMPGPRHAMHAVHDPLRNVVVMVGGYSPYPSAETWEWDGAAWAPRTACPHNTSSRTERACYRPENARVLLEGTLRMEWDGTTWTMLPPPAGLAVAGPRASGDLRRSRVLRFPMHDASIQFRSNLGVFTATAAAATRLGFGCAFGPAPGITTVGRPSPGAATFRLATATFAAGAPTLVAIGLQSGNQALGSGCNLWLAGPWVTSVSVASAAAEVTTPLPIPASLALRGIELFAQAAVLDPPRALLAGITMSDALRVAIGD
ncbi:MAG: hypothetical protein FJ265_18995 [Planctomycetes bacterium]|nr:hypothetical protein [Planctomycetota bacterium]